MLGNGASGTTSASDTTSTERSPMNENLTTSQAGIDIITRWEAVILHEYICPAGKRTIGIGHVVLPNETFPPTITREFAEQLLAKDLVRFEQAIYRNITVCLNPNQFDALVCFTYNVGEGGIKGKNGLTGVGKAVNESRFSDVPAALAEWSHARVNGQLVTLKGLFNRRKSEGELFTKPYDGALVCEPPPTLLPWSKDTLRAAQTKLASLGYYKIAVDGLWGPKTANALLTFSREEGISTGGHPEQGVSQEFLSALMSA